MNRSTGLLLAAIVIVAAVLTYLNQSGEPAPEGETTGVTRTDTDVEGAGTPPPPVPGDAVGAVPEGQRVDDVVYDERGVAIGGIEPNPSGGVPLNIDNIIANADAAVVISRDGADTFTVPTPGDPEWADYLEYRRRFRTSLDNSPGFVVAYDPEWRTQIEGKREVPDPGFELFGGAETLRGLLQQVLDRLADEDEQGLVDLALRKEEYEIICWPSFPQSRPFLRYEWEEAWGFQYASIVGGIKEGIRQGGGRSLDVANVAYDAIRDYDHFRVYENVKIGARDRDTGETIELTFVDAVIERNGVFKVFLYTD